jgi:hypothetical protein
VDNSSISVALPKVRARNHARDGNQK